MKDRCHCSCPQQEQETYGLDAAGQRVYAGDFVMASLPNVPAVRTGGQRILHPCRVLSVQKTCFRLLYVGGEVLLRRWSREPFLRGNMEVVKADISGLGLDLESGSGGADQCSPECCGCMYRRVEDCIGD